MQPISAPYVLSSHQPITVQVYSVKADYQRLFKDGVKLDAGLKASAVSTDYNATFNQLVNNSWVIDTGRTNHFLYKENIYAGYLTVSKSLGKKWEARAGLRLEETQSEGTQCVHYFCF